MCAWQWLAFSLSPLPALCDLLLWLTQAATGDETPDAHPLSTLMLGLGCHSVVPSSFAQYRSCRPPLTVVVDVLRVRLCNVFALRSTNSTPPPPRRGRCIAGEGGTAPWRNTRENTIPRILQSVWGADHRPRFACCCLPALRHKTNLSRRLVLMSARRQKASANGGSTKTTSAAG